MNRSTPSVNAGPRVRCDEWPWFARLVPVALIFVMLGPLIGGVLASLAFGAVIMPFRPAIVFDLPVMVLETARLAYGFGAALALLIGLVVTLSRICGGRTTIATPLAAAVLVYGAGLVLSGSSVGPMVAALLPTSPTSVKFLLLPMLVASAACWRLAREVKLL
ncbi:MAG TPA: hypothetical protein VNQ56_11635 [Pseudolabrys sp.]|nr:hypothetical protein [Pseudolabrys sp.]